MLLVSITLQTALQLPSIVLDSNKIGQNYPAPLQCQKKKKKASDCDFCRSIYKNERLSLDRHDSFYQTLNYKSWSCKSCYLLFTGFNKRYKLGVYDHIPLNIRSTTDYIEIDALPTGLLRIRIFDGGLRAELELYTSPEFHFKSWISKSFVRFWTPGPALGIFRNPGSYNCVKLVKSWVRECNRLHPECWSYSSSILPRRVIDVGSAWLPAMPKLYESHDEPGRYVALSHCWGSKKTFTTEIKTLRQRCEGMEWSELPKTYQDAITITRKLGIRYLWIDSLCILQDDQEDWYAESANMGNLYAHSYLTIAASRAPNDRTGFLGLRADGYVGYLVDPRLRVKVRKAVEHCDPKTKDPLLRRAWAFQERVLPSRVLSYGSSEMKWHCKNCEKCECGFNWQEGNNIEVMGSESKRERRYHELIKQLKKESVSTVRWDSTKPLFEYWRNFVVLEYTRLQLTKESDRLAALSAIASGIQTATQDTYLGGLWRQDLPYALAWESLNHVARLPAKYRAPSWSWASIEAPITYLSMRQQEKVSIDILEAHCTPVSINPTGEIRDGYIRLLGTVFPAELSIEEVPENRDGRMTWIITSGPEKHWSGAVWPDTELEEAECPSPSGDAELTCSRTLIRSNIIRRHMWPEPLVQLHAEVQMLYLGEEDKAHRPSQVFLVLVRSSAVVGVYERVAIYLETASSDRDVREYKLSKRTMITII